MNKWMDYLWMSAVAAIATVAMSSCNGNKMNQSGDSQDSTKVTNTEMFSSPDLAKENLFGKVKRVITIYDYSVDPNNEMGDVADNDTLDFTQEGLLARFRNFDATNSKYQKLFHRNEKGQLERYECEYETCQELGLEHWTAVGTNVYSYDEQGRVLLDDWTGWEEGGTDTFGYDEEGNLISCNSQYYAGPTEFLDEYTYTNLKKDDQGNWVKRKVKVHSTSKEEGEEESPENETEYFFEQTRIIEYYE